MFDMHGFVPDRWPFFLVSDVEHIRSSLQFFLFLVFFGDAAISPSFLSFALFCRAVVPTRGLVILSAIPLDPANLHTIDGLLMPAWLEYGRPIITPGAGCKGISIVHCSLVWFGFVLP